MKKSTEFLSFEKKARISIKNHYYQKYYIDYNILMINNIMWNAKEHLVSLFKDYLIFDELAEFFIAYYPTEKSIRKLTDLFSYYSESSFIFPNYTPLPESKYIYRSIIKKQRVIDEQENLEELKLKQKKLKDKRKNLFYDFYNDNGYESKFFNSTIYNSILKPSESLIKILFGIDNKNLNKKNNNNNNSSYFLNKNFINNSNSIKNINDDESHIEDYYNMEIFEEIEENNKKMNLQSMSDEDVEEIKNIIKIIYKYEKKKNINLSIKNFIESNNNNNKIKIKLGLLPSRIENNSNYNIIKTEAGKIGKNILNNYKSNNFFKNFNNNINMTNNNSTSIKQKKNNGVFYLKNNEKKNNINIIKFQSKTRADIKENIANNEINNPLIINNYNYKNYHLNKKNSINSNNQRHKKVKSTFCFNELNNNSNNDYLVRINSNDKNENNYITNYYRNEFNTPIAKRTQTLNKNINNYKPNKKVDNSIININININETNLYVNNPNKNNYYKKNDNYPKIIPRLDMNSIKKKSNSIRGKISKKTLCLKDLKNIYNYKNNNFTERNLIQNRQTPGRNQKFNDKFKLMLGLQTNNKKIIFRRQDNDNGRNNLYFTENSNTLKIKNNNNLFNKKKISNDNNQKNSKNNSKNKVLLTESLTKIKISDYYTDRNNYLSIK